MEDSKTSVLQEQEKHPPCRRACPAHVNVQAYIGLVAQGRFEEALEVIRRSIPFPSVCGRVCFSPCEDACTRRDIDGSVGIRILKRLVADKEFETETRAKAKPVPKSRNEKIAVIGSGPAGLTAAYELAKTGYPVTVFETAAEPGGCLRYHIPEYRLPENVLRSEIEYIKETGVEIKAQITVGKDISFEDLKASYAAVFLATGAHRCINLNLEGGQLNGVLHAITFLERVRQGEPTDLGENVAIIGGGNVAVDAARTARRLESGSKRVTVVYRRSEKEMPAHRKEIEDARIEGVTFHFLAAPTRILGKKGRVIGLECVKTSLGPTDQSGRRRPVPIEDSEFVLPADSVLTAIGEIPETSFLPKDIEVAKGNRVVVDEVTLQTNIPNVFAGGDAITGPASVIEAIAAGKKAAISIDRFIRGVDLKTDREREVPETTWLSEDTQVDTKPSQIMPCLEREQRISGFQEVELGLPVVAGLIEARRCLFCGPCTECLEPEDYCEADEPIIDEDRCIACANCQKICEYGAIKVEKSRAKVDSTLCKGCGTCLVECPADAISMKRLSDEKILSKIQEAATEAGKSETPQIVAFLCKWSYSPKVELKWPKNVHVVQVKCSGRVDPLHVLEALNCGADGVLVVSCPPKDCHYVSGGDAAHRRLRNLKKLIQVVGIPPQRIQIQESTVGEEQRIIQCMNRFTGDLKQGQFTPTMVKARTP